MAYPDIRQFLKHLEAQGDLYRFSGPINKDTEMFPLYRVQMHGLADEDRKVLLFENAVGADGRKFDTPVLMGVYGASERILTMHMQCESYQETLEQWHQAVTNPIPPVTVKEGPVQEEVHTGDELKEIGLDAMPAPVEDPGFSGVLRTGLPMISKDPETGMGNVGTYNGMFRGRDRITGGVAFQHHLMANHWTKARERKEGLPIAIVIGPPLGVMLVGSAPIPYGEDDLAIAGGLAGTPVEMVRCRTIPLEVPAHSEMVIEGIMSTEYGEPEGAFGEYPGYLNLDYPINPIIQVTAITHRKGGMFTPIQVSFTPSDCNAINGYCQAASLYHHLRYGWKFPVDDVYCPQMGGGIAFTMVRVEEGTSQETVWEMLNTIPRIKKSKYTIAFDHDIDLHNPDLLIWALTFSTQPKQDFVLLDGGQAGLDPSARPIGLQGVRTGENYEASRVLINATRKFAYPPVGLPAKQYMEKAIEMWKGFKELPTPRMRHPWYGYTLGHWNEDLQENADLLTEGQYLAVGKKYEKLRRKITDDMYAKVVLPDYDRIPKPGE